MTLYTPTQPIGSERPQRESNPGPPHQESHALLTELHPPGDWVRDRVKTGRENEIEREREKEREGKREGKKSKRVKEGGVREA